MQQRWQQSLRVVGILKKLLMVVFHAFEKAVEALSDEEKQKIFGPDTNIWYNAEIMDPGTTRVSLMILVLKTFKKYDDGKTFKNFINRGHFV